MDIAVNLDLAPVARDLGLPLPKVESTLRLLDEGNTVPFITRYRKDQTGGLDEEQIRGVKELVAKLRLLAERKATILKSIESQGKLTDKLAAKIKAADSSKRLEDLYLPFKPKKQTLATLARQRGLEPLADDILEGKISVEELAQRAPDYVRVDKQVNSLDDVMAGVRAILAERYGESSELRGRLRKIIWSTGKITCSPVNPPAVETPPADNPSKEKTKTDQPPSPATVSVVGDVVASDSKDSDSEVKRSENSIEQQPRTESEGSTATEQQPAPAEIVSTETTEAALHVEPSESESESETKSDSPATPPGSSKSPTGDTGPAEGASPDSGEVGSPDNPVAETSEQASDDSPQTAETASDPPASDAVASEQDSTSDSAAVSKEETPDSEAPATPAESPADATSVNATETAATPSEVAPSAEPNQPGPKPTPAPKAASKKAKGSKKKDKRKSPDSPFKDYFDYQEPVGKIPPHRMLAINRGERAKALRVRLESDQDALNTTAEKLLLPDEHPHREFLQTCLRDTLSRSVLPSLDREVRRELTERSESHAVHVFAQNLRKLLLQPPVRGRRVLAIDPGFRNGCKYAAVDQFGKLLDHGVMHIVGKADRVKQGREKLIATLQQHELTVVAIGNGTASRETENLIADILGSELKDSAVEYVIVNEAGASVYSTSPVGREELPDLDATIRGAISIGRRLLDPLSELVKINPESIGVGMYQHDVKVKHLRDSLDEVVASCVNFVGVDVNTASPALLRYVSGLNQLTARRLFEYRQEHGPFKSRDQLREVPGFGDATFVQAAGFLKIIGGDNPLDATWIHPESYSAATKVLEKLGSSVQDIATPSSPPSEAAPKATPASAEEKPDGATPADTPEPTAGSTSSTEAPAPDSTVEDAAKSSTEPKPPSSPSPQGVTSAPQLASKVESVNRKQVASELSIGELLLSDILSSIVRPGRDPREDLPPPLFRRGVMKLEDLTPGMELRGTVLNVVDFGAFVDIGLHDTGLVHISRLADRYVSNPHEVVSVGDILTVWVLEVDKDRRRVALTAIKPGTERAQPSRRDNARSGKPSRPPAQNTQGGNRAGGGRAGQKKKFKAKKHKSGGPRRPPKPVTPITDAMAEGREPLRSFSDLMQFYEKKDEPGGKKKKDKK